MKNKISIILLCIICTTCCYISVFGNGLLQQIYVDLKPINIVIDGEDKNPPSDMQPMIYNDRTYVPLRYVAESLGKDVDWDGDTRTVYIGEHAPMQKEIFESFTGPVSKNWEVTGTFQADGPNGYHLMHYATINLINFFPERQCDYTVEFEFLIKNNNWRDVLSLSFCKDNNNSATEKIVFDPYFEEINFNSQSCKFAFEEQTYYTIKADIADGQCNLYIDENYVCTFNFEKTIKPGLLIEGSSTPVIRNIHVQIND